MQNYLRKQSYSAHAAEVQVKGNYQTQEHALYASGCQGLFLFHPGGVGFKEIHGLYYIAEIGRLENHNLQQSAIYLLIENKNRKH